MKAAMTVWDGRVSPVFDVSRELVILTIENGAVTERCSENIQAPSAALKIDRLTELGVETLICGAISEPLRRELVARGLKVLGFVAGEIDDVVEAFLSGGQLIAMPGCCGKRNRFRGRLRSGRGNGRGCKGRP
jgi:predicted Fe-Mo cluster-binding NifX family protein